MTQYIKKLMKLAVFMAVLLAAVPQTAQAEFAPYATIGNTLNSLDPHFVLTGSLLAGSLVSYITLNNFTKRSCGCQKPKDRNCVFEAIDWVGNYVKHVATNTFGLMTIGVSYKALSGIEQGAMTTAHMVQRATDKVQHVQTQATTTLNEMSNTNKLGLAAAAGALVTMGSVLLYKKYIAPRYYGPYAGERDE